ncbi:hypothetical protein COLO4_35838 [Corchorus olitorius]|uniref:Uncharacterized protein n=1 Tax=Corchorus olitorius TaxID=93759 RepID=A0A1R3GCX6_9ROSI|nr:hypothetical protein COLO4_35838 [Corchorus olitorius]
MPPSSVPPCVAVATSHRSFDGLEKLSGRLLLLASSQIWACFSPEPPLKPSNEPDPNQSLCRSDLKIRPSEPMFR